MPTSRRILLLCTRLLVCAPIFIFYSQCVQAQIRTQVVGWLENSYKTAETVSDNSGNTQKYSEYLQNYQLGLKGYILSSNFLSYYLGSRFEESQKLNNGVSWRTRSFDWYDFTGNFFKNRRVALDLFLRRRQTDLFIPSGLDRRYEDTIGGELHLRTWWLPRTRIGYRLITTNYQNSGIYRTHQTTLYVQKGGENAQVEGSFRDEQRTTPNSSSIDRYQEMTLKGTADIWNNTTTLVGDVNYTGKNAFKALRSSVRMLGRYRQRDRLFALYSFNNTQNQAFSSYSNSFQGDYRRYISDPLAFLINTKLRRRINLFNEQQLVSDSEDLSAGVDYLSQDEDSLNTLRKSGGAFVHYKNSPTLGTGIGFDTRGFLELRSQISSKLQVLNSHSLAIAYLHYPDQEPYGFTNQTINNILFRPFVFLGLENRVTFTDVQGTDFSRRLEERGDVTVLFSRRTSFNSAVIINFFLAPEYREVVYWTNTLHWNLRRGLTWMTQSSWIYNRKLNSASFWVESNLEYRVRKLEFKMTIRDDIQMDYNSISAFVSLARIIGSGSEIR